MNDWKLRLRQSRERKALNKTELAKRLGVSNATVTDWEKGIDVGGIKELSASSLVKIHEVLGVDLYWLLSGKGVALEADNSTSDQSTANNSPTEPLAVLNPVKPIESAGPTMLQWISTKEAELLSDFRTLTVSEQETLLEFARGSFPRRSQPRSRTDQR